FERRRLHLCAHRTFVWAESSWHLRRAGASFHSFRHWPVQHRSRSRLCKRESDSRGAAIAGAALIPSYKQFYRAVAAAGSSTLASLKNLAASSGGVGLI